MPCVAGRRRVRLGPPLTAHGVYSDTVRSVIVSQEVLESRSRDLLELMNVMIAEVSKDGGTLTLSDVDYETGVVSIVLGGACGTCSLTGTTLEDGVKRIITQRLEWVTEVNGEIDSTSATPGFGNWRPHEL